MTLLKDALTFPWRGNAKWILVWLVVLTFGSYLAGLAPLVGLIATLFIAAYFCATYCHLIELSTSEDDLPVSSPDFSNIFGDFVIPTIRVIVVGIILVAPGLAYEITSGNKASGIVAILISIPGMVYAPMALLGWIVLNNPIAISPHIVIPSILRTGLPYLWIVLLIFIISSIRTVVLPNVSDLPFLGIAVAETISVYLLMTNARLIGTIYRDNKENLGWF